MQAHNSKKLAETDEVTIAEVNSELVTAKAGSINEPSLQRIVRGSPKIYPSIQCNSNDSVPKGPKPWGDKDGTTQALLDVVWGQLSQKYTELQQSGALNVLDGAWQIMAPVFKAVFRDEFAEMLGEKHHQNARNAYIKAVAWHPNRELLAVAHHDDILYVYQLDNHKWISKTLSHEFMVDISCLEWKYRAAATLAVGARSGVCIWELYSSGDKMPAHFAFNTRTTKNRPNVSSGSSTGSSSVSETSSPSPSFAKSAWMSYLQYPKHTAILSLSWDPTPGSHLLASTSALDSTVVIWDTLTDTATPLRRPDSGSHLVRWSPNGVWLFVASVKGHIRIWETKRWTDKLILNPSGRAVKSACWTPDGANVFYSLRGENDLNLIYFNKAATGIDCKSIPVKSFPAIEETLASGQKQKLEGVIRDIYIDQVTGERMVISFENSNILALFMVRKMTGLAVATDSVCLFSGYIRGASLHVDPPSVTSISTIPTVRADSIGDAQPLHITFARKFEHGSLLTIAWDNGTVTFTPLYFLDSSKITAPKF
ncbi:hypothetical protein NQZ79_g8146 [Umbelopsis isabellina]|nr:hypothetical protein NQZ79_g8146 [Umbelopsis isabellina]